MVVATWPVEFQSPCDAVQACTASIQKAKCSARSYSSGVHFNRLTMKGLVLGREDYGCELRGAWRRPEWY